MIRGLDAFHVFVRGWVTFSKEYWQLAMTRQNWKTQMSVKKPWTSSTEPRKATRTASTTASTFSRTSRFLQHNMEETRDTHTGEEEPLGLRRSWRRHFTHNTTYSRLHQLGCKWHLTTCRCWELSVQWWWEETFSLLSVALCLLRLSHSLNENCASAVPNCP